MPVAELALDFDRMSELHPDDEPLLDGLRDFPPGAWDLPGGDGALRQRLHSETAAIVRSRGRRRRVRRYAGFTLAYAAGVATAALLWPRPEAPPRRPNAVAERPAGGSAATNVATVDRPIETAPPQADRPETPPTSSTVAADPVALRRQVAGAPPAEQIQLLRRAGDLYLGRYGDLESALDCYRQVLELTPPTERGRFDAGDSWLLAELKHDHTTSAVAISDAQ